MDATQTSEPTDAGPGSAPGQASAYRRALDDQAISTEGPLDLTVPLDLAKIRAAMATTGPLRRVGLAAYAAAAPRSSSAGAARPPRGHRRARQPAAAAPRRIGRIALFVALTATLSVGTAWTLVTSTNTQNTSVSLPSSGAIPVAPSARGPQPGTGSVNSGSTAATAPPSPSRSPLPHPPPPIAHPPSYSASASIPPSPTAGATGTAGTDPTGTTSAGGTATASAPAGSGPSYGPGPAPTAGGWEVLYQGASEDSTEQQETTSVQSLLLDIGYLTPWHHRSYIDSYYTNYTPSPDPSGDYGSSTSDAVAQFQQAYSVQFSAQLGACDNPTYQALVQVAEQAQSQGGQVQN